MSRVKGFTDQQTAVPLMVSGELHQPDITNTQSAEVVTSVSNLRDQEAKTHKDALLVGLPVVASEFMHVTKHASSIEVHPEKTIENSRSAHGVGFGRFVGWLPRKKQHGGVLEVAFKPFEDAESALREFHGYRRLGQLMIETFEPVGVFPAKNGDHFVGVTKKRQDLMSLDRDEWLVGRLVTDEDEAETADRNAQTVIDVAKAFAYIHAQGIFHPDGQIKNWAITPEGKIGIIDTENLHSLSQEGSQESNDALEHAWGDIEKLVKSLILEKKGENEKIFGVGMFARMDVISVRAGLEQLLINPYLETLSEMSEQTEDENIQKYIYQIFEGVVSRFYDDQQWPNHFVNMQRTQLETVN